MSERSGREIYWWDRWTALRLQNSAYATQQFFAECHPTIDTGPRLAQLEAEVSTWDMAWLKRQEAHYRALNMSLSLEIVRAELQRRGVDA